MKCSFLLAFAAPAAALACGGYFYIAPPTLDHYPERLPGKTARQLLREARPAPAKTMTFAELDAEVRALAATLPKLPTAEARARIATAQQHNREGQYRKRFADALLGMEDLVTDGGVKESGAAAFLDERMKDMAWDDGLLKHRPKDDMIVFEGPSVPQRQTAWDETLKRTAQALAASAQEASPLLRPHWLVLAGAWQFRHARFEEARVIFEEVVRTYPQQPRSEIAQLMLVRVAMEEDEALPEEQRESTDGAPVKAAFEAMTNAWPRSRFHTDLPLWRAGWLRERGQPAAALPLLVAPLDVTDHPEQARRAARELDACLDAWSTQKSEYSKERADLPLDELARSPLAALAVVYYCLDSASQTELQGWEGIGDESTLDEYLLPMLQIRREGQAILPKLAKALAQQPPGALSPWKTHYLAVLAWASTQAGDHRQALELCRLAGDEGKTGDDLVFVRAVAAQRSGELAQAEAAFSAFRTQFPNSPLVEEVVFRLSSVLRDEHKEAAAYAVLTRTDHPLPPPAPAPKPKSAPEPEIKSGEELPPPTVPALHLTSEGDQWTDHILNFAPLPELEKALAGVPATSAEAQRLRQMLRWRWLAQENFAEARKYAPPASNAPPSDDPKELGQVELRGEPWKAAAASLESPPKSGKAAWELALGEAWAALRFQFVSPRYDSGGAEGRHENAGDFAVLLRNATFAGVSFAAANQELEARDELSHALPHWLAAATAAPGTATAAQALAHANDALHSIAIRSPWHERRAFETRAGEQSRALYERLRKECPSSAEAQRVVWWNFPPPVEIHEYDGQDYETERAVLAAFRPIILKEEANNREFEHDQHYEQARAALHDLASHAAEWDEKKLLAGLVAIRKAFLPWFAWAGHARLINDLDDLTLFLHQPKLTAAARAAYFQIRLGEAVPNIENPVLQPWRDFLTFLALVRESGPVDPPTDRAATRPMADRMREFLQKYPASPKREAAMARLAIAATRESHGHAGAVYSNEVRRYTIAVLSGHPEEAPVAQEALAAYEREFPTGRYAAEIRFWGGVAAMDTGDYTKALPLLVAALDSPTEPDLHLDAALNLAAFFRRFLDEPAVRPAWLAAMRTSPAAQQKLFQFMHRDSPGAELIYLEEYMRANLQ